MFEFRKCVQAGLDAARSETTVAGLGLVLAFLQPERKCVYRFRHGRSIQLYLLITTLLLHSKKWFQKKLIAGGRITLH